MARVRMSTVGRPCPQAGAWRARERPHRTRGVSWGVPPRRGRPLPVERRVLEREAGRPALLEPPAYLVHDHVPDPPHRAPRRFWVLGVHPLWDRSGRPTASDDGTNRSVDGLGGADGTLAAR